MTTPTELAKMFGISDLDEIRRVGVASVDVASALLTNQVEAYF